jgi:hypothetical protein
VIGEERKTALFLHFQEKGKKRQLHNIVEGAGLAQIERVLEVDGSEKYS